MAYPINEGSVLEVQYRYRLQGQQLINVFHYESGLNIVDGRAAAEEAALAFYNGLGSTIQVLQTTDVTDVRIRAQWVNPTRYAFIEYIPDATIGAKLPPTLSIGTSVVLKKISELAGQAHRGRVFVGGGPVADAVIGTLTEAATEAWQEAAGFLTANIELVANPSILVPIIWSYTQPLGKDRIFEGSVDPVLRYQRRREVGSGI